MEHIQSAGYGMKIAETRLQRWEILSCSLFFLLFGIAWALVLTIYRDVPNLASPDCDCPTFPLVVAPISMSIIWLYSLYEFILMWRLVRRGEQVTLYQRGLHIQNRDGEVFWPWLDLRYEGSPKSFHSWDYFFITRIRYGAFRIYADDELVLRITSMFRKPESISEKIIILIKDAVIRNNPYHRRLTQLWTAIDALSIEQQFEFVLDCAQQVLPIYEKWAAGRTGVTLLRQAVEVMRLDQPQPPFDELNELQTSIESLYWTIDEDETVWQTGVMEAVMCIQDTLQHKINPTAENAYDAAGHAITAHDPNAVIFPTTSDFADLEILVGQDMTSLALQEWQRQMAVLKALAMDNRV